MAETTNIRREVVRIEIEQGNVLIQRVQQMRAEMRAFRGSVRSADDALGDFGSDSVRNVERVRERVRALGSEMQQFRASAQEVATRPQEFDPRAVSRVGTSLRAARGIARGTAVGGAITTGALLADTLEGVGRLGKELPALTQHLVDAAGGAGKLALAGGALAAASIGLALAWDQFKSIVDDSKRATESLIEVSRQYAETITGKTTKEVRESIVANEERNEELREERKVLQAFADQVNELRSGSASAEKALLNVNDALGLNLGGWEDVKNRLGEIDDEINVNIDVNGRLVVAMEEGATAAEDYAAELEMINTLWGKFFDAGVSDRLLFLNAQQTLSTEQINKRIQALQNERLAIQSTVQGHAELTDAASAELGRIDRQIATLQSAFQFAETREQQQAITDAAIESELALFDARQKNISAIQDTIARLEVERAAIGAQGFTAVGTGKESERLREINRELFALSKALPTAAVREGTKALEDLAAAQEKFNRTLAREEEDFRLGRARDLADHYATLAQLDADFFADRESILADIARDVQGDRKERIDAIRDQNRDLRRLAEDHRDRMFRIERDSRRDILTAARRLDGIAFFDAKQKREDAIEDEDNAFQTEKERREEDFRDRLRELDEQRGERLQAGRDALADLEDQHRRERAAQVLQFGLRLSREDEDRAIRLRRLAEDQQRQRAAILQHFADQIGLTASHYQTMFAVADFGMQGVTSVILNAWNALTGQLAAPSQGGIISDQINNIFGIIAGALGAAPSTTINIDGGSADMVRTVLRDTLDGMG